MSKENNKINSIQEVSKKVKLFFDDKGRVILCWIGRRQRGRPVMDRKT